METCACIKKREFDISVTNKGCEYLVLEDQSIWVSKNGFTKPDRYNIVLKIPSRGVERKISIKTDGKTILSSKDLFGSKDLKCLTDDIYCITTESCGYTLTINRLYLCNIEVKYRELVSKYALTMSDDEMSTLSKLRLDMESLKINVEKGNLQTAKNLFKTLKDKLKAYHCDNC